MEEKQLDKTAMTLCPQCGVSGCLHVTPHEHNEPDAGSQGAATVGTEQAANFQQLGVSSKYEVLGEVGEGGMSVVYKARHRVLGQMRAIKMLQGHLLRDNVQVKRFLQEAHALLKLDHPNIVKVHDMDFSSEGKPYLVMDFLEGLSLSDQIKRLYTLPVPRALDILRQCCDALAHAHANGIVHRDIKPSNVLLVKDKDSNDVVKIVDFGIAKLVQEDEQASKGLTQTGEVFGSPLYMSPEQCTGGRLDARTDIYALGCVMYEALSGRPPFDAENALAIIHLHVNEMPEPLKVPNCDPGLCQRLDQIVFKCMEKDPKRRYQSMSELKSDLDDIAEATAYKSKTSTVYIKYARWHQKLIKQLKKHPIRYCVGFSLAAAAVIYAGISMCYLAGAAAKLSQRPDYIELSKDWKWTQNDIVPDPPDFGDRRRKGELMIGEAKNREGQYSPTVVRYATKMFLFLTKHGHFDKAQEFADLVYEWDRYTYSDLDPRTADAARAAADCYFEQGLYRQARPLYFNALKYFSRPNIGMSENRGAIQLRIALCDLKTNPNAPKALEEFRACELSPGSPDDAMKQTGIAECLWLVSKDSSQPGLAVQSQEAWKTAVHLWEKLRRDNGLYAPNVISAQVMLANSDILANDYQNAADVLRDVEKSTDGASFSKSKPFRQTYARVLWRANRWADALNIYNTTSM